jgi:hypothetical protein
VALAKKLYNVDSLEPSTKLAKATGCARRGLTEIIEKGEGAFYQSGSRPNQTAQSWGKARLASAITGGAASRVDRRILVKHCDHSKKAFQLAR